MSGGLGWYWPLNVFTFLDGKRNDGSFGNEVELKDRLL
jgi:hypothetical protein